MNQVEPAKLAPGMVLAKSIFKKNGKLLYPCGYVLTRSMITQLTKLKRSYFWMHDPHTNPFISEDLIFQQITFQNNTTTGNLSLLSDDVVYDASGVLEALQNAKHYSKIFMSTETKQILTEILEKVVSQPSILTNLKILKTRDYYSFKHTLEVTAASVTLARKLRMSKNDLVKLTIGSLLKELGMVVIPKEIVQKNSRELSFAESLIYQEHPSYGFAILKANKNIPKIAAEIVLQHHERQDGAGFPQKLRGTNKNPLGSFRAKLGYIHPFAEIVSICDTYVSLTAPRPGGPLPKTPEHVRRILNNAAGSQLNRELVEIFSKLIPEFPEGSKIVARDSRGTYTGFTGYVSESHPDRVHYPTILLTESPQHQKVDPVRIDLSEEKHVEIQILRT